jgi:hypothetical protein
VTGWNLPICRQISGCGIWVIPSIKMTQIRWASRSRSRSKERRVWRKDNQEAQGQDGVDQQALHGESRFRRDSTTDYAADNSSEHSSTATPLTQSPRHRLLNIQHGNDRHVLLTLCALYVCASFNCRRWRLWIRLRSGLMTLLIYFLMLLLSYATLEGGDFKLRYVQGWWRWFRLRSEIASVTSSMTTVLHYVRFIQGGYSYRV